MQNHVLCLIGLALFAGCESPAEQAKSAKYEKLYRETGEALDASEHALTVTEERLGKALQQLKATQQQVKDEIQQRNDVQSENDRLGEEIAKLKDMIEQLRVELAEAAKAPKKDEAPKKDLKP